jgi:putative inorganic carbon (hco3(-)) transporter
MNVSLWCTRVIRVSYYLLFTLVPLILTPWNYELFEFNKMMVTYAITVIIAASWAVKMIHERQIRITKTPLDIPIVIFFLSQLVSSLFSIDPHVSWVGYYSRFNGGMWSVISYIVLYYGFVSNVSSESFLKFLRIILGSSVVVALYAVAERLGVDKQLWVQDVQNRVFSTLGQPNWLAAYIVALFPVALVLSVLNPAVTPDKKFTLNMAFIKHACFTVTSVLFFFVLLCTRSRSGLLAFAVVDILVCVALILQTKLKKSVYIPLAFIHIVLALIIFFNGTYIGQIDTFFTLQGLKALVVKQTTKSQPVTAPAYAGPALETGGTESGTIRKYVWEAAVSAWKSSPKNIMIGTGTETFAFTFYRFRPQGHNMTSEWDFLYNKAHNEYLNYLATTGIFGLGSYIALLLTFIIWFIKTQISKGFKPLNAAIFAGWISILITNFFGFSVVLIQLLLFLFPALILTTYQEEKSPSYKISLPFSMPATGVSWAALIAGIILLIVLATQWYADTLFATSYRLARSGQYANAEILIEKATMLSPGEPIYKDEMSTTLISLAIGAFGEQNATVGGELANRAIAKNSEAINISPQNVNFWKTQTKIYYSLSTYDPKLNEAAIQALERAQILSPNDPKIYYNLAILYGRQSENDKAVALLEKARVLKPDYRDVYYALYIFYSEMKNPAKAIAAVQDYLTTVDPKDAQFLEILQKVK